MRVRTVATVLTAVAIVGALGSPALADVHTVRAAAGFMAYRVSRDACGVLVDEGDHGLEVHTWCDRPGRTRFTVRVPGVSGAIRGIQLRREGHCPVVALSLAHVGAHAATVRIRMERRFDFWVRTVTVRSTA